VHCLSHTTYKFVHTPTKHSEDEMNWIFQNYDALHTPVVGWFIESKQQLWPHYLNKKFHLHTATRNVNVTQNNDDQMIIWKRQETVFMQLNKSNKKSVLCGQEGRTIQIKHTRNHSAEKNEWRPLYTHDAYNVTVLYGYVYIFINVLFVQIKSMNESEDEE